jgi:hypothetical protein
MSRLTKFKVPQEEYDGIDGERNTYNQKLEVANADATRTPMSIQGKNVAKRVLEKHIRSVVKSYLINNPILTEEDLKMLGLPVHKTTRTPAPVATEAPDFDINTSVVGRITIEFFEKGNSHKKAKPVGQHCVEIGWTLSDTPITRWDELTHSSVDTHTPFTLSFENDQRGRAVYFALRWENTRGLKGPWSTIQKAIIP